MNNINNLLSEGLKNFNKKKYDKAIKVFKKILDIQKNNFQANHALGVCYGALKDHTSSKKFLEIALNINQNHLPTKYNLAISNHETGDFQSALNIYLDLIDKDSKNFRLYLNAGNCYFKLSNYENAISFLNKSLLLNKDQHEPYLIIGIIKKIEKKFDEALNYLLTAGQINQNNFSILYHIAESHYKKNNFQESINYLQKCLSLEQDNKDALSLAAYAHFEMGSHLEGKVFIEKLLLVVEDPVKKELFLQRAAAKIIKFNGYDTDKDYSLAFEYSNLVLKLNPRNYGSLSDRSIAKYYMGDLEGSVIDAIKAYEINPNSFFTLSNLANLYRYIGKYNESEKIIDEFYKLFPEDKSLNFLTSTVNLALNKFDKGWKYYESRWFKDQGAPKDKPKPNFEKPLWSPELGYDTILIWAEQGIGDQMLHGTMLSEFSKKFKKTYLAIDPRLLQIFKETFPEINVFDLFDEISQDFFDYQIPLTSLGQYCRNKVDDFLPQRIAPFGNLIKNNIQSPNSGRKLKCALSWSSSLGMHSKLKTIPLHLFEKILKIEQIDFYNIQYTDEKSEVDEVKKNFDVELYDPPGLDVRNDIRGVINFIGECDFVISCSNTNLHLSGAIGKKTFALIPVAAGRFWYWENNFEGKNLWYPSITIIEQQERYSWEKPMDTLLEMIKKDFYL